MDLYLVLYYQKTSHREIILIRRIEVEEYFTSNHDRFTFHDFTDIFPNDCKSAGFLYLFLTDWSVCRARPFVQSVSVK